MLQSLGGLLNGDGHAAQIVLAVVVLVVLIGLLYVLYRLLFAHRLRAPSGTRARGSRLGVVDVYGLDGQRQLVIVRRDNVEHLLMIGGPNDVVVEGNIVRATTNGAVRDAAKPAAAVPPPQSEPAAELPPAPFPRPVAPSAVSNVMKRAFSQRTEPSLAPAAEPASVRSEEAVVPETRAKPEQARQPPEPGRAGNNTVIPLPRAPAESPPKPANEAKPAPTPVESPPAAKSAPEPPPRRAPPPKAPEPAPRPALPSPIAPMRPRPAPAADTTRPNPPPPPAEPPPKPAAPPEAAAPPPAPVAPAPVSSVAADAASAEKPAQRKEEAFYDLESLEAEMARLLGRDG
jgi:flagellar protein FliO/FliZ